MGIKQLFPELKKFGVHPKRTLLSSLSGQTAAVDGHAVLHRFAVYSARELANSNSQPEDRWIKDAVGYFNQIHVLGISLIVVFDGPAPPAKAAEGARRASSRAAAVAAAREAEAAGRLDEAAIAWRKTVHISDLMVEQLTAALHTAIPSIRTIRAPFEADPQLAYLARAGIADFVIAEDSDLLCLGTPRLLTALRGGSGDLWCLSDVQAGLAREVGLGAGNTFRRRFSYVCVLLGCDYQPRALGFGPARIWALARALFGGGRTSQVQGGDAGREESMFLGHLEGLEREGVLPHGYLQGARLALAAFRGGWVAVPGAAAGAGLQGLERALSRTEEALHELCVQEGSDNEQLYSILGRKEDANPTLQGWDSWCPPLSLPPPVSLPLPPLPAPHVEKRPVENNLLMHSSKLTAFEPLKTLSTSLPLPPPPPALAPSLPPTPAPAPAPASAGACKLPSLAHLLLL